MEAITTNWFVEANETSENVSKIENIGSLKAVGEPPWDVLSPVTHIEIIKSSSRRVTGANRVVPLLTSVLKAGKLGASNYGLADVYKSFFCDLGNSDSNLKCSMCLEELLSSAELENHVKEVHKLNPIVDQCFVCRKKYVFEEQLRDHLHHIHGIQNPDLICKICFMEFNTSMEQKAHERKHDQTFSCQICRKKFSSEYLHQKHLKQHILHQGNINDCKKCGRRFMNGMSLEIHEKRHINVQCVMCEKSYENDTEMLLHYKTHDANDIVKMLSIVEQVDKDENHLERMLTAYSKIAEVKSSLAESEKSSDGKDVFDCLSDLVTVVSQNNSSGIAKKQGIECKLCGKYVTSNKELLEHRQNYHIRTRTCPFCGKRNRFVSQMWRHMKSHMQKSKNENQKQHGNISHTSIVEETTKAKNSRTNTGLYSCNICSRKFLYPGSRDNHVLQHSKDKCDSWKCTVCGDAFAHPSLLLSHSSIHQPPIQCNICNKQMLSKSNLRSHLKSHFTEDKKKKHKCSFCSMECPTLFGLQAHIRCHTGERPYSCGQCQRKFKRLQAVKKHIQVVHNSASLQYHSCSDCSKEFNSIGNMIRHYLRIHCQVRRFICGICGSRFGQNQDMRRHFKVFHMLDMPNINGTDRKSLKEIYVIPSIEILPETHPHAIKIKAIVSEEKVKFKGLYELMSKKSADNDDRVTKHIVKFLEEELSSECEDQIVAQDGACSYKNDKLGKTVVVIKDRKKSQKQNFLPVEYGADEMLIVTPDIHCDAEWILCKINDKQNTGGKDNAKQIAAESDGVVCQQCGLGFLNDTLLAHHLLNEHETNFSKFGENELPGKENYSIQNQKPGMQSFKKVVDVQCNMDQGICSVEPNTSLVSCSGENHFTFLSDRLEVSSENCSPLGLNSEATESSGANISAPLNINGIVLQNIIVQAPGILQTVPVAFHNQEMMNFTNTTNLAPVVAFNSVPVAFNNQTYSSILSSNSNHDIALKEMSSASCSSKFKERSVHEISVLSESSLNNENSGEVLESSPKKTTGLCLEETEERQRKEVTTQSDRSVHYKKKPQESKKPTCEFCGEHFFNSSSLNRHMKCHTEAKPFKCPHCGKFFSEKHNLKVHIMIHTGERPYTCEECGKSLRYRKDVLDHKRMHLGEKPFVCEVCGRRFIRQRVLMRHKIIHTGEKKHKCPICGKAFARLDQLKLGHLPTHGDVNSQLLHTCNLCDKTFKLKSKLKKHLNLHSGLKDFQCDICQKRFASGSYLKIHMKSHKKRDSYFQCDLCCRKFAKETIFQGHKESCILKQKKSQKSEKSLEETVPDTPNMVLNKGTIDLESVVGADIEMPDVDMNMIDADSCNAVIYLHMTPEDLKLTFSGPSDKLFTP